MIVIRPIAKHDFEEYVALALVSQMNFFTLPKDRRLLEARFEKALHSFQTNISSPDREFYLFVAEDLDTKKMVGVAAICATSGGNEPLYFFRKEEETIESHLADVVKKIPILNPISYVRGPTEVASLFVLPEARGLGVGKLLSFARFLFIARFSERFTGTVSAELRGKIENGTSLFWDGVGRHFFNKSFKEVQDLMQYGRSFISHFVPKYPIYVDLLPKEIQELIGKVDTETMAAFSLLSRLGFAVSDEVDILDAGPKLKCAKENILAISKSRVVWVDKIEETIETKAPTIISNERLDMRACFADLRLLNGDKVAISREVASCLEVGVGDPVRTFDFAHHFKAVQP